MRDEIMAVKKEIEELKQESFAMQLLKDSKTSNKRICVSFGIILSVILTFWFLTGVYLIKVLNNTSYEETITNTKTQKVEDVDKIENSNIINGDMYGKNNTD